MLVFELLHYYCLYWFTIISTSFDYNSMSWIKFCILATGGAVTRDFRNTKIEFLRAFLIQIQKSQSQFHIFWGQGIQKSHQIYHFPSVCRDTAILRFFFASKVTQLWASTKFFCMGLQSQTKYHWKALYKNYSYM